MRHWEKKVVKYFLVTYLIAGLGILALLQDNFWQKMICWGLLVCPFLVFYWLTIKFVNFKRWWKAWNIKMDREYDLYDKKHKRDKKSEGGKHD